MPEPFQLRLTNSEARTWRRCPRQWYLGTYRALTPRAWDSNRPLSIGRRVHEALAAYYVPGDVRANPLDAMRAGVQADLEEFPEQEANIMKEADLCDAMLTGYMDWVEEEGMDSELRVVEPEGEVEVDLGCGGPTLLSKIDARVDDTDRGKRLALEHKTAASLTQPLPTLQQDTQLLTEHLAEHLDRLERKARGEELGPPAEGVLYNMLRKVKRTAQAKPPFYARETVRHNEDELRNHWRHVVSVADAITRARDELDAGADHHSVCPPNPTKDCSWDCEFFDVCAMHDDGSQPEPAIQDLYVTHDPLERYAREWRGRDGAPSSGE